MEFNLLGPLEVRAAGGLLDVGPPQQRRVLAALAFDADRPVSVDSLVDRVWGEDPPSRARQMLYVYVARIRRLLREAANGALEPPVDLVRRSGGYALDGARDRVDLYRFRHLVCRSREPAGAAERARLLREALAFWRGEPLADLPGDWPARVRQAWRHEYLDTVRIWAGVESGLGNTGSVIVALAPLVEQFSGNEALVATMMRALHAAGRSAEALEHYDRARRYLAEQLGLDPGGELQDLHRAILRGEPADLPPAAPTPAEPTPAEPTPAEPTSAASTPAASTPAAPTPAVPVPTQLPLDVRGFAGRSAELGRLDAIAADSGQDRPPVAVVVVCGTAGVGKSALAVHWAHRVAARFPGGQLHVNLRGFDPGGSVVEPADALRRFLDSLGVPSARIPPDLDGRVGLYRSLLTDRRTLVVLDNARDADQVRPLLPGAPGSVVIVTSRNQLAGLVAAEAAHVLVLDLLSAAESRQLLARRLGHDRVDRETTAVDEIVTRCSRLPLALAVVAARAAMRTDLPLAALAEQLRGALDPFTGGDARTDVRAVFSWSYRAVGAAAARLFRLLGLHPGPDISAPAAASLAGIPPEQAPAVLAELTSAHLLFEQPPGRFGLHDLLRAYAAELAHHHDKEVDRRAAVRRLLDHYLHTAHDSALYELKQRLLLEPPAPGTTPESLPADAQALAWFVAEYRVLLAAVTLAADAGYDAVCWQLARTLWGFLDRQGHWHDWIAVQRQAVAAARRAGDPAAEATAHRGLALPQVWLARYDDARAELRQALVLHARLDDHAGEARTHLSLAWLADRQGRFRDAIGHAEDAIPLFEAIGSELGQAHATTSIGWYLANLGAYEQALTRCNTALATLQRLGDLHGESASWDNLGFIHLHLTDHAEAVACYRRAVDLNHQLGDRYNQAETLIRLGDAHLAGDQPDAARDAWSRALAILDDLDHPDADAVRARLGELGVR